MNSRWFREESMSIGKTAEAEWLSVSTALTRYGCGKTSFYSLLRSGAIEARKLGVKTLVRRSSADNYFATLPSLKREG